MTLLQAKPEGQSTWLLQPHMSLRHVEPDALEVQLAQTVPLVPQVAWVSPVTQSPPDAPVQQPLVQAMLDEHSGTQCINGSQPNPVEHAPASAHAVGQLR